MPPARLTFEEGMWKGRRRRFRPNRFIVKLREDLPAADVEDEVAERFAAIASAVPGAKLARQRGNWAVVHLPAETAVLRAIADFQAGDPGVVDQVEFIEPDFELTALTEEMPDDFYLKEPPPEGDPLWQWSAEAMGMGGAWGRQTGNDAVFVAIVDAGIRTHEDILLERFKDGGNFVYVEQEVPPFVADGVFNDIEAVDDTSDLFDVNGHGLAMSGVIAARAGNVAGIAGMNWGSPIGLCKALDDYGGGSTSTVLAAVIQAIEWAKLHPEKKLVISLSVGVRDSPLDRGRFPDSTVPGDIMAFDYMCDLAKDAGVVLVCATGNNGGPVSAPAVYAGDPNYSDNVLAVGCTYKTTDGAAEVERVYNLSNYGPEVSVVAPGHAIPVLEPNGGYVWMWGTSISAAYVAGLVSLVWSHNPELSAAEVTECIRQTARIPDDVTDPAETARPNDKWGWGKIDADRALECIEPRPLVSLAIDKSGSMDQASGTMGLSRMGVLRNAVDAVVHTLEPKSWIGVVGFSDVASEVAPEREIDETAPDITQNDVVDRINEVSPGGWTSIGGGVEAAVAQIDTVADDNVVGVPKRAVVLVTDGQQNRAPWIGSVGTPQLDTANLPVPVLSIAAGTPDIVDVDALRTLSVDTQGADLTTGEWADGSDQLIAKFILQHVTTVVGDSQVLDPVGRIKLGDSPVEIEFPLALDDGRVEVVALMPARGVVGMKLVTPLNVEITPDSATHATGVEYRSSERVTLYRTRLPHRTGEGENVVSSHEGTWQAVLEVDETAYNEYVASLQEADIDTAEIEGKGVPYTLIVNARSRLRMETRAEQAGSEPGAELNLQADITLDRSPLGDTGAAVEAIVRSPVGSVEQLPMNEISAGRYAVTTNLAHAGVYNCQIVATGSFRGHTFRREHAVAAAVYDPASKKDEEAPPPPPDKETKTGTKIERAAE